MVYCIYYIIYTHLVYAYALCTIQLREVRDTDMTYNPNPNLPTLIPTLTLN
jgi:hypothetical protein